MTPQDRPRKTRTALLAALALAVPAGLGALALHAWQAPAALAQEEDEDSLQEMLERAMEQLQAKDYPAALATYAKLEAAVAKSNLPAAQKGSVLQLVHYNSACAHSLAGDKEKALASFEKALDHGFYDWDHIREDTDLDAIREEARFKAAIEKHQKRSRAEAAAAVEREKAAFLKEMSPKDALFAFDFDVKGIDDQPLRLADMRGKVVLVDIWGTWCPPCRKEVPHLAALHQKLGEKGFAVVGLNCERVPAAEAPAVVKKFVAEQKIPYRCAIVDGKFPSSKVPNFEGFPTMLLVDRAGKVRMKIVGYTEAELLEAAAEKLLAEPAPEGGAAPAPTPAGGSREF